MTETELGVRVIASLISFLGIWLLLFWLYRDYRVDAFRQRIFALRDELFDWVSASELSFDNPAYGILRSAMNGFIRFGHRMSLGQLAIMFFLTRDVAVGDLKSFGDYWKKATEKLDSTRRNELENFRKRMHLIVFRHLMGSPVLMVTVVLPVLAYLIGQFCFTWTTKHLRVQVDEIDTMAVAAGQ